MESRPSPVAILAIAGLAAFTVWITWQAKRLEKGATGHDRSREMINKPAPEFTLPSLEGRTVSLAEYCGKRKVVVSFWASWCGPCRMEMPMLQSFYQRMHKPDADFEFLAVSIDTDREPAQSYATETKLAFPVLLDPAAKTADAYLVSGIPALYVIDQSGKVVFARVGFDAGLEFMLAHELGIEKYTPAIGAPDAGGH